MQPDQQAAVPSSPTTSLAITTSSSEVPLGTPRKLLLRPRAVFQQEQRATDANVASDLLQPNEKFDCRNLISANIVPAQLHAFNSKQQPTLTHSAADNQVPPPTTTCYNLAQRPVPIYVRNHGRQLRRFETHRNENRCLAFNRHKNKLRAGNRYHKPDSEKSLWFIQRLLSSDSAARDSRSDTEEASSAAITFNEVDQAGQLPLPSTDTDDSSQQILALLPRQTKHLSRLDRRRLRSAQRRAIAVRHGITPHTLHSRELQLDLETPKNANVVQSTITQIQSMRASLTKHYNAILRAAASETTLQRLFGGRSEAGVETSGLNENFWQFAFDSTSGDDAEDGLSNVQLSAGNAPAFLAKSEPHYEQGCRVNYNNMNIGRGAHGGIVDMTAIPLHRLALLHCVIVEHGKRLVMRGFFRCTVPHEVAQLSALVELNLSFNSLASLPSFLTRSLPQLEILRLRSNPLHTLPSDMHMWSKLRILDASFCQLHSLPHSLFSLKKLQKLNLAFNCLTWVNDEIALLVTGGKLTELKLKGNDLYFLPYNLIREAAKKGSLSIDLRCNMLYSGFRHEAQQFIQQYLNAIVMGCSQTARDKMSEEDATLDAQLSQLVHDMGNFYADPKTAARNAIEESVASSTTSGGKTLYAQLSPHFVRCYQCGWWLLPWNMRFHGFRRDTKARRKFLETLRSTSSPSTVRAESLRFLSAYPCCSEICLNKFEQNFAPFDTSEQQVQVASMRAIQSSLSLSISPETSNETTVTPVSMMTENGSNNSRMDTPSDFGPSPVNPSPSDDVENELE